jgi:hypothetical protein
MRRSQRADTQDHRQPNGDIDIVAALEARIRVAVKVMETGLALGKVPVPAAGEALRICPRWRLEPGGASAGPRRDCRRNRGSALWGSRSRLCL